MEQPGIRQALPLIKGWRLANWYIGLSVDKQQVFAALSDVPYFGKSSPLVIAVVLYHRPARPVDSPADATAARDDPRHDNIAEVKATDAPPGGGVPG